MHMAPLLGPSKTGIAHQSLCSAQKGSGIAMATLLLRLPGHILQEKI